MPPAAFYRAIYMTLWRLNERHEPSVRALLKASLPANDCGFDPWSAA